MALKQFATTLLHNSFFQVTTIANIVLFPPQSKQYSFATPARTECQIECCGQATHGNGANGHAPSFLSTSINTIYRINKNIQQHHTITSSAGAQRLIPMAALILPPKKTTLCHQAGGLHASHANKQPSIVPTVPTMLFCLLS